jgi:hypothetical protein
MSATRSAKPDTPEGMEASRLSEYKARWGPLVGREAIGLRYDYLAQMGRMLRNGEAATIQDATQLLRAETKDIAAAAIEVRPELAYRVETETEVEVARIVLDDLESDLLDELARALR